MRKKIISYYCLAILCALLIASFHCFNIIGNLSLQYVITSVIATLLSLPIASFVANIIINNYSRINWQPTIIGTVFGEILGIIYTFITIVFLFVLNENIPENFIFFILIIGFSGGGIMGAYAATIGFVAVLVSIVTGSIIGAFSLGVFSLSVKGIAISIGGSVFGSFSLLSLLISLKGLFYKSQAQQSSDLLSLAQGKLSPEIKALLDLAKRENDVLSKTKIVMELGITPEVADEILKYAELNSLCQTYLDEDNGLIKYKFNF